MLGIITMIFGIAILISYNDTPIVRASGRELSFFFIQWAYVYYFCRVQCKRRCSSDAIALHHCYVTSPDMGAPTSILALALECSG